MKIKSETIVDDGKGDPTAYNASRTTKVFRVQVFALSTQKPVNSFGIPNLKVREFNGVYKYYIGDFDTYEEAKQVMESLDDQYRSSAIVLESRK